MIGGADAKTALGRIASIFAAAALWVLLGVRVVLDLIGYSTAPEDLGVARTRLDQFLDWVFSLPWWAVLGVALVATLWLMWVSWPRAQQEAAVAAPSSAPSPVAMQPNRTDTWGRPSREDRARHLYEGWDSVDPLTMTQAAYLWAGEEPRSAEGLTGIARAKYITLTQGIERQELTLLPVTLKQQVNIQKKKFGLLDDVKIRRESLREFVDKNNLRPAPFVFKEDRD